MENKSLVAQITKKFNERFKSKKWFNAAAPAKSGVNGHISEYDFYVLLCTHLRRKGIERPKGNDKEENKKFERKVKNLWNLANQYLSTGTHVDGLDVDLEALLAEKCAFQTFVYSEKTERLAHFIENEVSKYVRNRID